MELRGFNAARCADFSDDLPPGDGISPSHKKRIGVGVCRNEPAIVLDQQEISKATDFLAGISHNPIVCGPDRRTSRRGDVHTIIVKAVFLCAEG